MTGKELKARLTEFGKQQKDIAELLGVTAQSLSSVLSAKDVRSGTIERIAQVLRIPVSLLYGENNGMQHATASGNYSAASIHGNASVGTDGEDVLKERIKMLEQLLDEKERTIKILMDK